MRNEIHSFDYRITNAAKRGKTFIKKQMQIYNRRFIHNWVDFEFITPYKINDELILRKPNSDDLAEIKEHILNNKSLYETYGDQPIYEIEIELDKDELGFSPKTLDVERQKYWVFEALSSKYSSNEYNNGDDILQYSLNMLDSPLYLSLELENLNSSSYSPVQSILSKHNFKNYLYDPFNFPTSEIEKLKNIINSIEDIKENYPSIFHSIKILNEMSKLSDLSDFKILSYFSILESLITHKPKNSEDSITKQIVSKIKQINNELSIKINFNFFFKQEDEDKIIKKLYAFRSAIAHGGSFSFEKKKNKILKDRNTVLVFIRHLVKRCICYAILEPQLITDLKKRVVGQTDKIETMFEKHYPYCAAWINTTGWIELGANEESDSTIRVLNEGGMVWENDDHLEKALQTAEKYLKEELPDDFGIELEIEED